MDKKIFLLFALVLYFAFNQNAVFAQEQVFRQLYIDYTPYAEALPAKIITNWNPTPQKKQRSAIISVNIDKDGTLDSIKVLKSSNKKKFDYEAIDAIMKSVPYDPLPANGEEEIKNFQISFVYDKTKDKTISPKYIITSVQSQDGYDQYIKQVDKVIAAKLCDKSYYWKKDFLLTMKINKKGGK